MKKYKRLWLYRTDTGKYVVRSKSGTLYIADSEKEASDYAISRLLPDGTFDGTGCEGIVTKVEDIEIMNKGRCT